VIVVRGTQGWRETGLPGPVLTIGNFDGVHRGHRTLLDATVATAAQGGAPSAALTFDPSPREVLRPDHGISRIESPARNLAHLAAVGLDAVVVHPFDRALAALDPGAFAANVLRGDLGVVGLVVGHDFRFGRGRSGTADDLRALGVPVHIVPPLADTDGVVSSSRIRDLLRGGDVAGAARLLGRSHEIEGVVVEGDKRGRTLGFPTANVAPDGGLLPPDGVYAVRVDGAGLARAPGVANLGTRPTFDGAGRRLEVHVLDAGLELYGRTLVVGFVDRVRAERKFASVDELKVAIQADVAAARELLA
jgi:riboflavin kinase/FMN adenylyltransferase